MGAERPGGLRDVQATLYDLITAPEGAAKRLDEIGRPPTELEAIVRPSTRLSAVERVDIYANMYFFRILDVLRDEDTRTVTALGDDAFHNLVTDYLVACRPAHPSLREAGARLPAFLAAHPLATDRPWLAELAQLERAHLELYDGQDADVLTMDLLRGLAPDALPSLALRGIPCHRILRNRFDTSSAWRTLGAGESLATVPETPETLLVWRQDVDVYHRSVDVDEGPLLAMIAIGARFAEVCERLLESVPEDRAAARAFEILARWVTEGLIARPPDVAGGAESGSSSRR